MVEDGRTSERKPELELLEKRFQTVTALGENGLLPPDDELDEIRDEIFELYGMNARVKERPNSSIVTMIAARVAAMRLGGDKGKKKVEQINTIAKTGLGQEGLEQLSQEFEFVRGKMGEMARGRTAEGGFPSV